MLKKIMTCSLIGILFSFNLLGDEINRDKYLTDSDYINGMLYLEGKKGISTIIKEISNCPYEMCRKSDVSNQEIAGTVKIEVDKPDYKKAVEFLTKSVEKGNFLAADKLVLFLVKRIDYKSKYPDKFILELLKDDTGLSYDDYKKLLKKATTVGSDSKGCASPYYYAEFIANGYLEFPKIESESQEYYKISNQNCPKDSFFHMLSSNKVNVK